MVLKAAKIFIHRLFRLFFSVEYYGLEKVPSNGAVIIAGNHPSYLDPLLVGLPIRREIKFMAWDALFKVPLLGLVIKALGAFPVDIRKGRGEAAFNEALGVLNRGYALGIFPEGQRSEHGPLGELKTGVARLAIETGAPIVPVTIGGAFRAWPKWKLLPKPARIIVRYHSPIYLDEADRHLRRLDREYHLRVMQQVAESINRSLTPALHSDSLIEKWYRQPPSSIRSYEWAPLIATLISLLITLRRGSLSTAWPWILLPPAAYYLYLMADLALIKPSRTAKWLRNSMPLWMIPVWHYPLVKALAIPFGERNVWLLATSLAAFFPFFYEDYFALQKFVRGMVVSYYFSLALLLGRPNELGTFTAVLGFIVVFVLWYRVAYRWPIATVVCLVIAAALSTTNGASRDLWFYAGLALATNLYLQTFTTIAYDIRRAGNVTER